ELAGRGPPHEHDGGARGAGGGLGRDVDALRSPRRVRPRGAGRLRSGDRGAAHGVRDPRHRARAPLGALRAPRIHPRPSVVTTPVLEAAGIRVTRGGRTVLDVPVLAVPPGEVLALIGPNGAGKSTLLRVLGLLETPAAGEVRFRGAAVASRG